MAITLTEKAAQEVQRSCESGQFEPEAFLRIRVTGGGCSGLSYSLAFDDQFDEVQDSRFESHGVTVVVDKKSSLFLDGTQVDWHESLEQRGFVFDNPNVVKSCGCGSSFQV